MPPLTPEAAAVLLESTVSTELSFYAARIRQLIAEGDVDPQSCLFRLADLDQQGWSDPWTGLTAIDLVDLLERDGLDLERNEKTWLLFCLLYEFVDPEKRPLAVLRTENQVINGEFQPQTGAGQQLADLWLEIIYTDIVNSPDS